MLPQGYSADFPYSAQGIAHSIQIQSNGQIVAVGCNEDEVNAVVRSDCLTALRTRDF